MVTWLTATNEGRAPFSINFLIPVYGLILLKSRTVLLFLSWYDRNRHIWSAFSKKRNRRANNCPPFRAYPPLLVTLVAMGLRVLPAAFTLTSTVDAQPLILLSLSDKILSFIFFMKNGVWHSCCRVLEAASVEKGKNRGYNQIIAWLKEKSGITSR